MALEIHSGDNQITAGVDLTGSGIKLMTDNWALEAIAIAKVESTLSDDDLLNRFLGKGPCLLRFGASGEQTGSLSAALSRARRLETPERGAASISILNQPAGLIVIASRQIERLLASLPV